MEHVQAYPLQWPIGWKRTPAHQRTHGKFTHHGSRITIANGADRVYAELQRFGIGEHTIVISSDLRPRLDGRPYSDQALTGVDPGIAVYWAKNGKQHCMAIDRYLRPADNLGAIAITIESMRSIERHGGAVILDRAFAGFAALPAPLCWWQILGLDGPNVSRTQIDSAYRRRASDCHPDKGGTDDAMAELNRARELAYEATL